MGPDEGNDRRSGPIFVVGAVRSGTTLMRLVLDSHENIAIPQETGIMRTVQALRFTPFWKSGERWYRHLGVTDEEFEEELRTFYGRLFSRFADASGKRRWGEKTPWHVWHMETIARVWPEAVFVGVARHPGGNVGSLRSSWHMGLRYAIRVWRDTNIEMVRQGVALGSRFVLCRYEDLVLRPDPTMRGLLTWLGEPWSPDVLRHHEVQPARGAPSIVEGRTRPADAIDASRVTKWRVDMSDEDLAVVRRSTSELAAFFGYSFDDVGTLAPITSGGSDSELLCSGRDLAKRKADLGAVELDARPPVPLADRPLDPRRLGLRVREGGRTRSLADEAPRSSADPLALRAYRRTRGKAARTWRAVRARIRRR